MLNISVAISACQLVSTSRFNYANGCVLHTASKIVHVEATSEWVVKHNFQSKIISTKFCKRPICKNFVPKILHYYSNLMELSPQGWTYRFLYHESSTQATYTIKGIAATYAGIPCKGLSGSLCSGVTVKSRFSVELKEHTQAVHDMHCSSELVYKLQCPNINYAELNMMAMLWAFVSFCCPPLPA